MKRVISTDEALRMGLRYWVGNGVRANKPKARALLLQAAEAGDPTAMYFAAQMLENGMGGPFDRVTAFRYIEQAAGLGNLDAIHALGSYYMNGGMSNVGYSDKVLAQMKVPRDEVKALVLWRKAAARGHALAAYRVGEFYENRAGENAGVLASAIKWYKKSLKLGEPNSLIRLGDFYVLGKGLPKNRARARSLYRQAAQSDDYCAKSTGEQRLNYFAELETLLQD